MFLRQSLFINATLIMSLVAVLVIPVCAHAALTENELYEQQTGEKIAFFLKGRMESSGNTIGVGQLLSHKAIVELYQGREFKPVWMSGWLLRPIALDFMEHLRSAGSHGLCNDDYLLTELEELIKLHDDFSRHGMPLAPANRAVLDLFLSQAFLTFATHLTEGQVDPALTHVDWKARRRKANLVKLLNYAINKSRVDQVLNNLYPPHDAYRKLVGALQDYNRLAALGGWPHMPEGPSLRPGQRDDRLPILRDILVMTGDLTGDLPVDSRYESVTREAVKRYQGRHGLVVDGIVGAKTRAALNVPVEERIRQIELNLERWRWMPKNFGSRHLTVNIADFSLEVVEDGELVMQMPVIVGTKYRKTPVFSARMTYLEFSPHWTVPPTILREDKLPKIQYNSAYLQKHHFRILKPDEGELVEIDPSTINWKKVKAETFPGLLRMDPGPWNPLGRVKFMFPNGFNVYLHDTNEPGLFTGNVRSYSSGCIRIKRPLDLAHYLLEESAGLSREDIRELFSLEEPLQVGIPALPVHIQYWTAWVDRDDQVHFRKDVYLRDLDLKFALEEPAFRVNDQLQVSSGLLRVGMIK